MSWNYRILKHETHYEVVECYYNDDGTISGYCSASFILDAPEELSSLIEMLKEASNKPVIELKDITVIEETDDDK